MWRMSYIELHCSKQSEYLILNLEENWFGNMHRLSSWKEHIWLDLKFLGVPDLLSSRITNSLYSLSHLSLNIHTVISYKSWIFISKQDIERFEGVSGDLGREGIYCSKWVFDLTRSWKYKNDGDVSARLSMNLSPISNSWKALLPLCLPIHLQHKSGMWRPCA